MSLETWKREFYPIDASEVSEKDAVAHSLRKWIGLRSENLKKHNLVLYKNVIYEDVIIDGLSISGISCALCELYYNYTVGCDNCPLFNHLGDSCDDSYQPYDVFRDTGNAEPMIEALEAVFSAWMVKNEK